jgi:hypothetical protein
MVLTLSQDFYLKSEEPSQNVDSRPLLAGFTSYNSQDQEVPLKVWDDNCPRHRMCCRAVSKTFICYILRIFLASILCEICQHTDGMVSYFFSTLNVLVPLTLALLNLLKGKV